MQSVKTLCAAVALTGAMVLAGTAQAATIVTIDNLQFSWGTPDGVGPDTPTNIGITGDGTDNATINWGTPLPTSSGQSGYNIAALASSFSETVNPPPSSEWDLAEFTHFNNGLRITPSNTSISGVPLTLSADVTVGGLTNNYSFNFYVHHDETINDLSPCPYGPAGQTGVNSNGCADQVTFEFLDTSDSFTIDGVEYTLTISGFTQDGVQTNTFLSKENQDSSAIMRAKIVTFVEGNTVPEPGTWILLIAGFGLVGVAARRRRSHMVKLSA